ncbi:MAG: hypothetical protein DYG94_02990 [Leptolyngbya sp. PLA3]|nr:MAG: hypothetical protein EDM82_11310 [Cyanobacteria bacterium CYA]MCE7967695.1 hypothetical protein [Leptolyngbya sp. PL-A3]
MLREGGQQASRPADWNEDARADVSDALAFPADFHAEPPRVAPSPDRCFNFYGVQEFLSDLADGCP